MKSARERFFEKVRIGAVSECWPWLGCKSEPAGYGLFWFEKRMQMAHRVAWMLQHNATIPDGLFVMHQCDNPPCVNHWHLRLGTAQENIDDMFSKGRQCPNPTANRVYETGDRHWARQKPEYLARGLRNGNAKLSDDDVRAIRSRRVAGEQLMSIAAAYGVAKQTVIGIVFRRTRRDVV